MPKAYLITTSLQRSRLRLALHEGSIKKRNLTITIIIAVKIVEIGCPVTVGARMRPDRRLYHQLSVMYDVTRLLLFSQRKRQRDMSKLSQSNLSMIVSHTKAPPDPFSVIPRSAFLSLRTFLFLLRVVLSNAEYASLLQRPPGPCDRMSCLLGRSQYLASIVYSFNYPRALV